MRSYATINSHDYAGAVHFIVQEEREKETRLDTNLHFSLSQLFSWLCIFQIILRSKQIIDQKY